jgi:WD40 repeat protein
VPLGPDVRSREDITFKVVQVIRAILGANPEEMPQDPAEAGRLLGSLLDARPQRLLVLDDVRSAEQAAPFVIGGRRSARLITTQQRALVGGATEIQVDQMTPDEAVELLTRQLPKPPAAELATRLAEAADRWPQLLILARGILSAADEGGEGWLDADEAAEHLTAQIRDGGADSELNHNRASIIEAAIARLKRPDGAERLAELRAFTAGQPIPAEIVAALWHVTAEIDPLDAAQLIAEFYRLSLALRRDGGLVLHEVIRDHVRSQAGEGRLANLDGQLVRGIAALYPEAEALPGGGPGRIAWWQPIEGRMTESATAARYVDENILRHMLAAGQVAQAEALVCDPRWILHRLQASGTAAVLADLALVGTIRAANLGAVVRRVGHALTRPDSGQFLLDTLKDEPMWRDQARALLGMSAGPALASSWRLPDNPGPGLVRVYSVPGTNRWGDATAFSADAAWAVVANGDGLWRIDLTPDDGKVSYLSRTESFVQQVAIGPDGRQVAIVAGAHMTVLETRMGSIVADSYGSLTLWTVAFSPDGNYLITTDNGGQVKLWEIAPDGQIEDRGPEYFDRFHYAGMTTGSSVAIVSGDGEWAVSGGSGQVFLWDLRPCPGCGEESHEQHRGLPACTPIRVLAVAEKYRDHLVTSVAVAPDRSWVAGATQEAITVWNAGTGEVIATERAQGPVTALAAAREAPYLASGDTHGTVLVWQVPDLSLRARFDGHANVSTLQFAPGDQLLYSSGGGQIRAWDLAVEATDAPTEESRPAGRVVVSPTGSWAAVALQDGDVHIRDPGSGEIIKRLAGACGVRQLIVAARNGEWLATEHRGTIKIWDTASWELTAAFDVGRVTGEIYGLFASDDNEHILTADGLALRSWQVPAGQPTAVMATLLREPASVTFCCDGAAVAVGDYYGSIWIWDTETGALRSTMRTGYFSAPLKSMAAAPGNQLLAYSYYGSLETWDTEHAKLVDTRYVGAAWDGAAVATNGSVLAFHQDGRTIRLYSMPGARMDAVAAVIASGTRNHWPGSGLTVLACSADGKSLAVGQGDSTTVRTSAGGGPVTVEHRGYAGRAIALSSAGEQLAVAAGHAIRIWQVQDPAAVCTLTVPDSYVQAMAFSPDGTALAVVTGEAITILDLQEGSRLELHGDLGGLRSAAISPGGRYLATAGASGVRVWEERTGRALFASAGRGRPDSIAFGRCDKWLAVATRGSVDLFGLPDGELLRTAELPRHHQFDLTAEMLITPVGAILIRLSSGTLVTVEAESTRPEAAVTGKVDENSVIALSPTGEWLAVAGSGEVSVRRLTDWSQVATYRMNRNVNSLTWSPDSASLACAGDGGVYYLQLKGIADGGTGTQTS